MTNEERQAYLDGTKQLISFLEANPTLTLPFSFTNGLDVYCSSDKNQFFSYAKVLPNYKKVFNDTYSSNTDAQLHAKFGIVQFVVFAARSDICIKKVIGTRLVKKEIPLAFETKEVMEDIVEWECGSLLEEKD